MLLPDALRREIEVRIGGCPPTRENDDGRRSGPRNWIEGPHVDGQEFPRMRGRVLLAWGPFVWSPWLRTPTAALGAALAIGEICATPRDPAPRWETSLFCFTERQYQDRRIDPASLAFEGNVLTGVVPGEPARTRLVRPLGSATATALAVPRGVDLTVWARQALSLDARDPSIPLNADAGKEPVPHLVATLPCAACGRPGFRIEVIPPHEHPAAWSSFTEKERREFDLRRWPEDYWLDCEGPGGGTGGMATDRETAARAWSAFGGTYDFGRVRAADWLLSAGVCPRCEVPYCWEHWNVSDSGYGRCPAGHGQVVDPLARHP